MTEVSPLRWHRTVAIGFALVFVILAVWTWWIIYFEQKATDFLSYWAAAKLAVAGQPWLAYDVQAHRAVELSVTEVKELLAFPYPPPFLLVLMPVGLIPYPFGFVGWVAITAALYLLVSWTIAPLAYRMAHPQALANTLIGQNGFLTAAIFVAGTRALPGQPLVGGMILGLMVIKPQLALLLPVALIAGGEWRAMFGAAASSIGILLLGLLVLGAATYEAFLAILPLYPDLLLAGQLPWNELASVFAFARHLGVSQQQAFIVHLIIALAATALVWRAWSRKSELRVPVLAAATLLIPPYIFTYDALLLIVPMGWLIMRERRPLILAAAWLFCLLPIVTYIGFYPGPNTIPIAALLCLWALHAEERRQNSSPQFASAVA